ncbi:MAG: hypothetical protein AB7K73_10885 [Gammaproteobacteria bacterium]
MKFKTDHRVISYFFAIFCLLISTTALSENVAFLKEGVKFEENAKIEPFAGTEKVVGEVDGILFTHIIDKAQGGVASEPDAHWTHVGPLTHWGVRCVIDSMTDEKTCALVRNIIQHGSLRGYRPFKVIYNRNISIVCVGEDLYPNKPVQIRVDKNLFYSTDNENGCFDPENSRKILDELGAGNKFVVRFIRWPYEGWETHEIDIYGYPVAVRLLKWMYESSE